MVKNIIFLFLMIPAVTFAQLDSLRDNVILKCNRLETDLGQFNKRDRRFFIDLISSHYLDREEAQLIDANSIFENYMSKVLAEIVPYQDSLPRVVINKSPYPNAFTQFLGDININWGILAELESEASLAYLLGHEFAHDSKAHIYKSFLNRKKSKDMSMDDVIHSYHSRQENEFEADKISFELASKAGYNWEQGVDFFYEFQNLDSIFQTLKASENSDTIVKNISFENDTVFVSHPSTMSRIKKWKDYAVNASLSSGVDFLISKKTFNQLKSYSIERTLESLLENYDLNLGLIKAFKYYSLNEQNPVIHNLFYQFVTRRVMSDTALVREKFFSDLIKTEKGLAGSLKWIFRKENQKIKGQNLIKEFNALGGTYGDVIKYLESVEINLATEYYLAKAIYHVNDEDLKNESLLKYLSKPNSKHPEFARSYMGDSLIRSLEGNSRDLVLFDDLTGIYMYEKGITSSPAITSDRYNKFEKSFRRFFRKRDEEFTSWNDGSINKSDARVLESYINLISNYSFSNNSWMRHPEVWTVMERNNIKEFELIKVYEFQNRTINYVENFFIDVGLFLRGLIPVYAGGEYGDVGLKSVGNRRDNYNVEWGGINSGCNVYSRSVTVKDRLTVNLFLTEVIHLRKKRKWWAGY